MHRLMIPGLAACLAMSGCAWMHGTPTTGAPGDSQTTSPPPAPRDEADSSKSGGSDQGSTPEKSAEPTPPAPTENSAPGRASAKPKPPPDTRAVKQAAGAPATQRAPAPAAPTPAATTPAATKSSAATLDLADLEQRLRDTRAIGVFTKLSLKNQVDDLLGEFRALYQGPKKHPPVELRQRYDQLLLKVLGLLQDGDPPLAAAIASSREAIWSILADPEKFSKI
jgi:hypothetical protein